MLGTSRRPKLHRVLVVGGGLVLAVNLLVIGGLAQDSDDGLPDTPTDVEALIPSAGSVIRPQEDVGVDLRDDLVGVLRIDGGAEIPEDQYDRVTDLGRVVFRPGPGQDIREFEPGRHEITVLWWPRTETREGAEREGLTGQYTWQFAVG